MLSPILEFPLKRSRQTDDLEWETTYTMEVTLVIFAFFALSVLCVLCLVVLEYQNSRSRRWSRLWAELEGTSQQDIPSEAIPQEPRIVVHDLSAAD